MQYIDNVIVKAKSIPLIDYLASEGVVINSRGFFALRDERTPSCKIHRDEPSRFIDFGSGESGDVIDAYRMLHPDAPTNAAEIARLILSATATTPTLRPATPTLRPDAPTFNILSVTEPSANYLLGYAWGRGIPAEIVRDFLWQVEFATPRSTKLTALGWQTIDGGWHGRNGLGQNGMKLVLSGGQNITYFKNAVRSDYATIFEGVFTALSHLLMPEFDRLNGDVILLNSAVNARKAIDFCNRQGYRKVYLLLDRDPAGTKATETISAALCNRALDLNPVIPNLAQYDSNHDLNDILQLRAERPFKSCLRCKFLQCCNIPRGQWTFSARVCKYYTNI